jgi:hypothetical protein
MRIYMGMHHFDKAINKNSERLNMGRTWLWSMAHTPLDLD